MNLDLTRGKPSKVLLKFSLPMFGSILFQQLYNIADSLVSGKFVGENALAAVGNSYEVTLIYLAFAFGCNIGCSVVVSRLFGRGNFARMKTAVYTTIISSVILCIALMTFGFTCSESILHLIKTPENIIADSKLYLNIYTLGLPFMFLYNVSNGIFSAMGDSKTPFIFLACSSSANIVLDILFVTALGMGVDGVAWATFICQGISCVLALVFMLIRLKKTEHEEDEKPEIFSFSVLKSLLSVALPSVAQQLFISVGNIIIQSVINSFGPAVIAGFSAAIKLNSIVLSSFSTLANGVSTFTAQNMGARKPLRVREGYKAGIKLVFFVSLPFFLCYFFGGEILARFFINNPSAEALKTATQFLKIVSPFYILISTKLVADSVMRGAGFMKRFMLATFVDLLLRVVLALTLSPSLGTIGVWVSWPIGWSIAVAISNTLYFKLDLNKNLELQ